MRSRPVTAAAAAMALYGVMIHIQPAMMMASAFSISGSAQASRSTNDKSTERSYGQNADVDIALPAILGSTPDNSKITTSTSIRTSSPQKQPSDYFHTRRRRQHDRMVRPKSLHSSSNKLEAANAVVRKTKKQHNNENNSSKNNMYPQLLTKEEEIQLTGSLRTMRSAVRVRDHLVASRQQDFNDSELCWQPSETEWALACDCSAQRLRRILVEGHEARNRLVAANGGLVRSIAKKHFYSLKQAVGGVGTILTLQDLVQEGNLGLMEAAERFDPSKGCRFSTYATWWVRQRILKSISEYSRVIRLPAHVHSMLNKINKARKSMQKEIGRPPSVPELAHYLEMSVDKLRMYTDSSRSVLSLEVPVSQGGSFKEDDRRTLGDRIASDSPTPQENAEVESLRRAIREVVNELAERERDVLVMRFGLDDGSPKTVEETSKRLGISRDRVRLVETRALNKLRHPQRNYKLKEYVGRSADVEEDDEQQPHEFLNLSPERIWSF